MGTWRVSAGDSPERLAGPRHSLVDAAPSYARSRHRPLRARGAAAYRAAIALVPFWEHSMGKYFVAWLLGVPAFLLVIVYLFFGR
jgi:hypothetical protein